MYPSTVTTTSRTTPSSISPLRKRSRSSTLATKEDLPLRRRLRARIDHSQRVWAGRCGCIGPHCTANEFEFSSDACASSSDSSDEDADDLGSQQSNHNEAASTNGKRPPQDPADLVPMMLHLMLMM